MLNPWEGISLDNYEKHMSLDSVKQLQALNTIMKEQFEVQHKIEEAALTADSNEISYSLILQEAYSLHNTIHQLTIHGAYYIIIINYTAQSCLQLRLLLIQTHKIRNK